MTGHTQSEIEPKKLSSLFLLDKKKYSFLDREEKVLKTWKRRLNKVSGLEILNIYK